MSRRYATMRLRSNLNNDNYAIVKISEKLQYSCCATRMKWKSWRTQNRNFEFLIARALSMANFQLILLSFHAYISFFLHYTVIIICKAYKFEKADIALSNRR